MGMEGQKSPREMFVVMNLSIVLWETEKKKYPLKSTDCIGILQRNTEDHLIQKCG